MIDPEDHRRLAKFLKSDCGYSKGDIRLISCSTGKEFKGFAQNLANKMGVSVMAPSDTLYIYPNGKVVIEPNQFKIQVNGLHIIRKGSVENEYYKTRLF